MRPSTSASQARASTLAGGRELANALGQSRRGLHSGLGSGEISIESAMRAEYAGSGGEKT